MKRRAAVYGLATYAAAESIFYLWRENKIREIDASRVSYDDFDEKKRSEVMAYILRNEFHRERGAKWLSKWFFERPLSEIYEDEALTFLTWAFFNKSNHKELSENERRELKMYLDRMKRSGHFELMPRNAIAVTSRRNDASSGTRSIRMMRPNQDSIVSFVRHKPLCFYFLNDVIVQSCLVPLAMNALSFERRTLVAESSSYEMDVWVRRASVDDDESTALDRSEEPIVLMHGIGIGLLPYLPLIRDIVSSNRRRNLYVFNMPHVAMTAPKPWRADVDRHFVGPAPDDFVYAIDAMLKDARRRGELSTNSKRAVFVGHSYGCWPVTWLVNRRPDLVRRAVFVDPVCVGSHRADLARRFLYDPGMDSKEHESETLVRYVAKQLINRDPRVVALLCRNFKWYDNILDVERIARDVPELWFHFSEKDEYFDTESALEDILAARDPSVGAFVWSDCGHGDFLFCKGRREDVVQSALGRKTRQIPHKTL